jgi:hypothetical protein
MIQNHRKPEMKSLVSPRNSRKQAERVKGMVKRRTMEKISSNSAITIYRLSDVVPDPKKLRKASSNGKTGPENETNAENSTELETNNTPMQINPFPQIELPANIFEDNLP